MVSAGSSMLKQHEILRNVWLTTKRHFSNILMFSFGHPPEYSNSPIGVTIILGCDRFRVAFNASGSVLYHVGQGCKLDPAGRQSVTTLPSHSDAWQFSIAGVVKLLLMIHKFFRVETNKTEKSRPHAEVLIIKHGPRMCS
jgi:hypothetical protein